MSPDRAHRFRISEPLEALIRGLHPELKRKVRAALDAIREDPSAGKKLRGDLAGLRSYRVGRFRVIYRVAPRSVIDLVAIGPRRGIYEDTFRLLRRDMS